MCEHLFRHTAVQQSWRENTRFGIIVAAGWQCIKCDLVAPPCFHPVDSAIADLN